MDVEKVCPFCDQVFSSKEIKAHIGISHLGIESVEQKTEDKIENFPNKKRKRSGDLQQNENKKVKTSLFGAQCSRSAKYFRKVKKIHQLRNQKYFTYRYLGYMPFTW